MGEIEGFALLPPAEEDLICAEAAWKQSLCRTQLAAGSTWWRVLRAGSAAAAVEHSRACFASDALNRFTPVGRGAQIVPAAYAGSTAETALWETVLRGIRHAGLRRVPYRETRDRYLVKVRLSRALTLLNIRRPSDVHLVAQGKRPPDLSRAWPAAYGLTREWAQQLYSRLPEMDGMIYESHQVPADCLVLYCREPEGVFEHIGDARPVADEPVRSILKGLARVAGTAVDFEDLCDEDLG